MRTDKTRVLAAERQDPMTAAAHAAVHGLEAEYARDVPASCACLWQWSPRGRRYVLIGQAGGCPWHTTPEGGNDHDQPGA